jgi:tetratricopeptide (TPR) repeat protein
MSLSPRSRWPLLLGALVVLAGAGVAAYLLWPRLPGPGSPIYQEYLRAFQVGVAAIDTDQKELALARFDQAIELIPEEPAGWANRGLYHLRKNQLEQAAEDLGEAATLAPESGEIAALLGQLAEKQGRLPEAVAYFRKAVAKDPRDLASLYTLAETLAKEGGPESEADYQRLMEKILEIEPNNLPVLVRRARAAFQRKDLAAFNETVGRLDRLAPAWSEKPRNALAEVKKAASATPGAVPFRLTLLDNLLKGEPGYSRDYRVLVPQLGFVGAPVQSFLRLRPPRPSPAPPDRELTFTPGPWAAAKPATGLDQARWDVLRVVWLVSDEQRTELQQLVSRGGVYPRPPGTFKPAVFLANAQEVRRADADTSPLPFPGGPKAVAPSAAGVLPVDWDNDFRIDLLLAGAGGLKFYHQQPGGSFADVTNKTGLPAEVIGGDYYGAWAADVELDGDLDIILARRTGPPLLLRNNRDGTFTPTEIAAFKDVDGARAFAWADLDNDGAPDAAFLDEKGKLHVFANERSGQFKAWPLPEGAIGPFAALTAADVNDDGVFDLVALRTTDGALVRISDKDHRHSWDVGVLAKGPGPEDVAPGTVAIFAADLDNNGALDLVLAGPHATHVYLADEQFRFKPLPAAVPLRTFAVLDLDGDGRLDLLGLSAEGRPVEARNKGVKNYHHQVVWAVASPLPGDGRNNTFALGGEIEVRSGLLVQKQRIDDPLIHFGLGEQEGVNVARVVWPTGVAQVEFELPAAPLLVVAQRLIGSCPFLFTYDGTGMRFGGDFMWGTPLGMYINAQKVTSGAEQTTEWLKIPGDALVPRDGYYDVRAQANLWETDYFDQLALIVVDHPPGTEIYTDERFFLTPTPPELFVTTPARPVARAWDHLGQDATELVSKIDGRYLDRCGRGPFQGVTCDHWVEVDLGDDVPDEGPVYLIARGWLHPTDSSINVAIEQGKHDPPRPLSLEVPDGKGGWKVGRPALGFPAGKNKTMLIRLDGIEGPHVSRRFRLRTNMEIFWDFLGVARGLDPKLAKLHRPEMLTAELRYRGILQMTQKDASSPELPHYDKVKQGVQAWRDLTGWYTRFGDVRELLARVDDRYVIMNAGDEIALRFAVPDAPPPGWVRDFLWECDGWTRDGNPNTRFGTTVLPLPAHGKDLDRPPGLLEDDPVYRLFPQDWQTYHTRYITPYDFERGLRTFRRPAPK